MNDANLACSPKRPFAQLDSGLSRRRLLQSAALPMSLSLIDGLANDSCDPFGMS